jgi:hypothetical protein
LGAHHNPDKMVLASRKKYEDALKDGLQVVSIINFKIILWKKGYKNN